MNQMIAGLSGLAVAVLLGGPTGPSSALAQPEETIEVVNQTDHEVTAWIGGAPAGVVPARSRLEIAGAPRGPVTILATDRETGALLATESTVLAEGERFTWTLEPIIFVGEEKGTGLVQLVNNLDCAAAVTLGGNSAGELSPGATRVLPRVVAGTVTARAVCPDGERVIEESLTIEPGETTIWRIGEIGPG